MSTVTPQQRATYPGAIPARLRKLDRSKRLLNLLSRITPRRAASEGSLRRIGVLLQWGIGDAVLALPLLEGLAQSFSGASIEPIGKPWLAELFADEKWLGRTHQLVPPWTAYRGKYRIWTQPWRRFRAELSAIRNIRFDLLIGVRLDPRETVQLRLLSAGRSAGTLACGGAGWITDPLPMTPEDYYFRYRAEYNTMALKALTGREGCPRPRLQVGERLRESAIQKLRAAGYEGGPIVAIHNGAGSPVREWRPDGYAELLDAARKLVKFVVVIDDGAAPAGPRVSIPDSIPSMVWKSGLGELKGLLSISQVLLCCDSGIMHIGAACGARVVAIFGAGSPEIFFPRGGRHELVKVDPMPCRPCMDDCIYPSPICIDRIAAPAVHASLLRALAASSPDSAARSR
ncbi:MAG TPA: glycosyltransferase family 9 protein [Candidatus Binataceae bacterium]|nr:glycosyltransferase family 9 protein [Candidatus Binataceae bacterium]